jgi:hypothetical protein
MARAKPLRSAPTAGRLAGDGNALRVARNISRAGARGARDSYRFRAGCLGGSAPDRGRAVLGPTVTSVAATRDQDR